MKINMSFAEVHAKSEDRTLLYIFEENYAGSIAKSTHMSIKSFNFLFIFSKLQNLLNNCKDSKTPSAYINNNKYVSNPN